MNIIRAVKVIRSNIRNDDSVSLPILLGARRKLMCTDYYHPDICSPSVLAGAEIQALVRNIYILARPVRYSEKTFSGVIWTRL